MRTLLLPLFLLLPISWASPAQEQTIVTYSDFLHWMTNLDWLTRPPVEGERCIQFASYDPGSRSGVGRQEAKPWDPKGWYANIDRGHYLREEMRAGKTEYVLADVAGPGAIVRIWSANPTGTLFFYVDGATEPTWSAGFEDLTSGKVEPFVEPFAGVRGRGCNFHAPLPFNEHVKVTCSKNDHHFQVGVRLLPWWTEVESFHPDLLTRYQEEIAEAREQLLGSPVGEKADGKALLHGTLAMSGDPADPSAWTEEGVDVPGPCVIREVTLDLGPPPENRRERANLLRRILFCVSLEGRRTVKVPVSDFFGSAPDFAPFQSYPMGVDANGKAYCRFPMPVPKAARVYLLADGPLPPTGFELEVRYESCAVPADTLVFHADWHLKKQVRTRPFSDFRVLNAAGPGRFVGCTLMFMNPSIYWWGEGDEKFFVDGERFPSTFGTGTEDYFGYAWADPNPFSSPFHAQTQVDGPESFGYTGLNRWQLHDQVPFFESFLFDLEIWHWKDVYVDYATCAYWYGRPEASSGLPFVPDPVYREVDEIVPEAVFRGEGALEGEDLRVVSKSAGETEGPLMGWYAEERWSNERQLFWKDAGPGDELKLAVPIEEAGEYAVEAVFTRAPDYAIVSIWMAGEKLGDPVDLYSPHIVEPTRRIRLGQAHLAAGEAELLLRIEGKNERAVGRHLVGLDYLRLTRK